jgi:hypothetical protein
VTPPSWPPDSAPARSTPEPVDTIRTAVRRPRPGRWYLQPSPQNQQRRGFGEGRGQVGAKQRVRRVHYRVTPVQQRVTRLPQTALPTPENAPNRPRTTPRNTVSAPKIFALTRSPTLPPPDTASGSHAQNPAPPRDFPPTAPPQPRIPQNDIGPAVNQRGRPLYSLQAPHSRGLAKRVFAVSETARAKGRERNGERAKRR